MTEAKSNISINTSDDRCGTRSTKRPGFVLGAFRRNRLKCSCHCGEDATHIDVALLCGDVIMIGVCEKHARSVTAQMSFHMAPERHEIGEAR